MPDRVYEVPDVSCEHCVRAIREEVGSVAGVAAVDVDLEAKRVTVRGDAEDGPVRAAIEEAGYEVAS
jgi:copper ion binding protein